LMKREATEHVITAIHTVLTGKIYVSDRWRQKLMSMYGKWGTAVAVSPVERLSDRELEVLQLTGQGFTTRHIAENLHVSVKTVESHYANIKEKLDLKNLHELIQYSVKWTLSEQWSKEIPH